MDLKIFEIASNIVIPLLGAINIYFIAHTCKHKNRWGFTLNCAAQPFWLFTTIYNGQWGIFVLACWHTYCVFKGTYKRWIEHNGSH